MARLEVLDGGKAGSSFSLGEEISIGRGMENDISLPDDLISRRHARVWRQKARFVIEDLDSTNGTFLRGRRLAPGMTFPLVDGDEVQLGTIRLLFHAEVDGRLPEQLPLPDDTASEAALQATLLAAETTLNMSAMPLHPEPSTTVLALDASSAMIDGSETDSSRSGQGMYKTLQRLQTVYQISRRLGNITEWDALMEDVLACLFELFPHTHGAFVILQSKQGSGLVPIAVKDCQQDPNQTDTIVLPQAIAEQVLTQQRSILLTEPGHKGAVEEGRSEGEAAGRSMMCVPLLADDETLGFIQMVQPADRDGFSAEGLQILTGIGTEVARAIKHALRYQESMLAYRELSEAMNRQAQIEKQLRYDALHDVLTGLPNRALFLDRLGQVIERLHRNPAYRFAVLFLDLDSFKRVNDSFGHVTGDRLLIEIAQRLAEGLRRSDTVARLGGDEFAVLLDDMTSRNLPIQVVERIQSALGRPFKVEGHEIVPTASIGIALSTMKYERPEEMMRAADTAMYWAKEQGGGRYAVFSDRMQHRVLERVHLEAELRRGVEHHEFLAYYQPIVALATGALVGFEALVRWDHPERGLVAPAAFLPTAEETGLIMQIDREMLRQACRQMYGWQRQFPGRTPAMISVNISGKQFRHPEFPDQIAQILHDTGLEAPCLNLEISENVLIDYGNVATTIMAKLRGMGVQLAIDDFGTGYSSLGFLQRFPLDMLKIDHSFVKQIGAAEAYEEVLSAIVGLAHALNMQIIAEGVENTKQFAFLNHLKCAYGQGYFFSGPLEAKMAAALLAESNSADTAVRAAG